MSNPQNPPCPQGIDPDSWDAIIKLNQLRTQRGLPAVALSPGLSLRCKQWAWHMQNGGGLNHDRSVMGTQERENIAMDGAQGGITVESAFDMWVNSGGHAAAMFDRGWDTAVKAGYGQVGGYASLRLCPGGDQGRVCCE